MEILQPAKLMDDTETDDGDPLLLAQHGEAGSKAWKEEVEVGGLVSVEGEQGQEEEDGREELCSADSACNSLCVNRVNGKEKSCELSNLSKFRNDRLHLKMLQLLKCPKC